MCLSDVYQITSADTMEHVATKVSNIAVDQGVVTLVDIFGDEVSLKGEIENIDLLENKIYIRSNNQGVLL